MYKQWVKDLKASEKLDTSEKDKEVDLSKAAEATEAWLKSDVGLEVKFLTWYVCYAPFCKWPFFSLCV
jgi:hypothetical protein